MTEAGTPLRGISHGWVLATTWLCLLPLLAQLPNPLAGIVAVAALATGLASWRRPLPIALKLLLILAMLTAVYWQAGSHLGRDTGCALLAAMLAIKASELRSLRDARSLLGFALFAPFAAFLLDQGPLTTAFALLATLAALLSMQQVADAEAHTRSPLSAQLRGIARMGLLGLPLVLATFWLFPRLGSPLWGIPARAMTRPGLSEQMAPGEWLDLMADDTPAMRVRFFGAEPPPAQRYWRGPVLTDFDGQRWTASRWRRDSPPEQQSARAGWDYQIDYEPTDRRQLVALDLPLRAPPGSRLDSDRSLHSDRPLANLTRWRLRSAAPLQFQADLPEPLRQMALRLPPGFNPRTLALARQWRRQAGDDNAIVQRMLDWIRREFTYTLDTPLLGHDSVDAFLFQYKSGFCEHFSSAFVVVMRAAGIPARVVTGYAGGIRNPLGDYWIVRRMDAHAWAEVWLTGRGWVRVDPTAAVAPERVYDTLEERAALTQGAAGTTAVWRIGDLGDWLRHQWNERVLSFDAARQQRLLRPLGIARLEPPQLIAVFAVVALAALGGMTWLLSRGERERDPLLRAWHRLERGYARHGLARALHEPALQWALRVHACHPDAPLVSLSQRFAEARYAGAVNDRPHLIKYLIQDLHRHRPSTGASP